MQSPDGGGDGNKHLDANQPFNGANLWTGGDKKSICRADSRVCN